MKNIAFIDGQNLYMGTRDDNWSIDYGKFRIYLRDKYDVVEVRYLFGYFPRNNKDLYTALQKAGFTVSFREHADEAVSTKKGNVDTDIVFEIMKKVAEREDFERIILVSSDGDYKKMITYLILKDKFKKILFPNKKRSSLYNSLDQTYFDYLENVRAHIQYRA